MGHGAVHLRERPCIMAPQCVCDLHLRQARSNERTPTPAVQPRQQGWRFELVSNQLHQRGRIQINHARSCSRSAPKGPPRRRPGPMLWCRRHLKVPLGRWGRGQSLRNARVQNQRPSGNRHHTGDGASAAGDGHGVALGHTVQHRTGMLITFPDRNLLLHAYPFRRDRTMAATFIVERIALQGTGQSTRSAAPKSPGQSARGLGDGNVSPGANLPPARRTPHPTGRAACSREPGTE